MVEELNRFPLLRRGGAFSVNKKSAQASMKALKYAIDVIEDTKNALYIFPQGIIKPPNFRPIEFQTGLAYIAQKAAEKYGKVNLIPIGLITSSYEPTNPRSWSKSEMSSRLITKFRQKRIFRLFGKNA